MHLETKVAIMFMFFIGICFACLANAQVPVPSVAATAVAAVTPTVTAPSSAPSSAFIGIVVGIVALLNVGLSAVQQLFSALSKSEPGWLQKVSSVILSISKYLGSNPNV